MLQATEDAKGNHPIFSRSELLAAFSMNLPDIRELLGRPPFLPTRRAPLLIHTPPTSGPKWTLYGPAGRCVKFGFLSENAIVFALEG